MGLRIGLQNETSPLNKNKTNTHTHTDASKIKILDAVVPDVVDVSAQDNGNVARERSTGGFNPVAPVA